jgi:hypothetical protein
LSGFQGGEAMNENVTANEQQLATDPASRLIDWYAVGQGCEIEIGGVVVRFHVVSQKGRRVRIAIVAPPSATFTTGEGSHSGSRMP